MLIIDLIKTIVKENFNELPEDDLTEISEFIVSGVKHFDKNIVKVPVVDSYKPNKNKGFYFFKWNISFYKKLWFMFLGRYPIISDIKLPNNDDKLHVTVNGRKRKFKIPKSQQNNINLEIDISTNVISYSTRG